MLPLQEKGFMHLSVANSKSRPHSLNLCLLSDQRTLSTDIDMQTQASTQQHTYMAWDVRHASEIRQKYPNRKHGSL